MEYVSSISKPLPVKHRDIGGLLYVYNKRRPTLILFNQWRSGAQSLFSKHLAELLSRSPYGALLFIDRIGTGGESRNTITSLEKQLLARKGDALFAEDYADVVHEAVRAYQLSKDVVVGGSSGASAAAYYTAKCLAKSSIKVASAILVEPTAMRQHGFGKKHMLATSHAIVRHLVAYRHRLQRGWWRPVDREQYFAKSNPTEYRGRFYASDVLFTELRNHMHTQNEPTVHVVFARRSHTHSNKVVLELASNTKGSHSAEVIPGNHDHACQPETLAHEYAKRVRL